METPINERIIKLIEALGESNNRFAKRVGTSSAVISHIVTGRNKPNIDLLYKILKVLPNVDIQWLVLGQGNMLLDSAKAPDDHPETSGSDLENEEEDSNDEDPNNFTSSVGSEKSPDKADWDQFLQLLEQMLDSQKMAHQSMEQNLATQKQMLQWFRSFFNKQ